MKLQERLKKEIYPSLLKQLNKKNLHELPRIEKISVNIGLGTFLRDNKDYEPIMKSLSIITGQRPFVRKARKAISNFKVRQGMVNGLTVTLRGTRMYDFLDRFVNIVLPRVRDFRGLSTKAFDKMGNYSVGIKEHIVFPEINADELQRIFSFQININTSAKDDKESLALLKSMGFPFKKDSE